MKTKKILTAALLLAIGISTANAQTSLGLRINQFSSNSININPHITDFSSKFNVKGTGLSIDLLGTYGLKAGSVVRLGLGYTRFSLNGSFDQSNTNGEYWKGNGKITHSDFTLAPGIAKPLLSAEKYGFYTGVDLPVTIIGKTNINSDETDKLFQDTDFVVSTYRVDGKMDGGFSLGISPFIGFHYFVAKQLSIGTELSLGLKYSSVGSSATFTYYQNGSVSDDASSDVKMNSFYKTPPRVSLTIAYHFGKGE